MLAASGDPQRERYPREEIHTMQVLLRRDSLNDRRQLTEDKGRKANREREADNHPEGQAIPLEGLVLSEEYGDEPEGCRLDSHKPSAPIFKKFGRLNLALFCRLNLIHGLIRFPAISCAP